MELAENFRNRGRVAILAVFYGLSSLIPLSAESYRWTGGAGDNDFNNKLNYQNGDVEGFVLPGPEDSLSIPAGNTITLEYDVEDPVKKASCETFAAIGRILPTTTAMIDITVPENQTLDVSAAIVHDTAYTSHKNGTIVKRGAGQLSLNSAGNVLEGQEWYDYFTSMRIVEGVLQLQQATYTKGARFGDVTVEENGILSLPQITNMDKPSYFYTLSGTGVITNATTRAVYFTPWNPSTFGGRIVGKVGTNIKGRLFLTGTDSTFVGASGVFTVSGNKGKGADSDAGVAGIMKFGNGLVDPSSVGTNTVLISGADGGAFIYLGSGGSNAKRLSIQPVKSSTHPTYIDGGPNGGLHWTGWWSIGKESSGSPDEDYRMARLVIQGSNTQECVMSGRIIQRRHGTGTNVTFCITKQGTGAWRMVYNDESDMLGVWRIVEGNLRFDSIAERGVQSSLGNSTLLYKDLCGIPPLDENKVDYAFWLGGGESGKRGNLEYVGTTNCMSKTRKFAMNGTGGVLNNGTGFLQLSGFYATNTASTLVIGGTNTLDLNVVDNISDGGDATLSVVKEDSGFWRIGTNCTFTGSLDVKGGTCVVGNPSLYRFYRWVVKENFCSSEVREGSTDQMFGMLSLGLFDSEGNDRAYGLTDAGDGDGEWYQGPKYYTSCSYGFSKVGTFGTGSVTQGLDVAEGRVRVTKNNGDGIEMSISSKGVVSNMFYHLSTSGYVWSRTNSIVPRMTNVNSWIMFTMHPVAGAPITSWDFVNVRAPSKTLQNKTYVKACDLEASVNGADWDLLYSTNYPDYTSYPTENTWRSDNTTVYDPSYTTHTTGMPIPSAPRVTFSASSVSVAAGASLVTYAHETLSVPQISVDVSAGMGTLRGFALSEGGTINVTGLGDAKSGEVDVNFSEVKMPDSYTFLINGEAQGRLRASFTAGGTKIAVYPIGGIISIR